MNNGKYSKNNRKRRLRWNKQFVLLASIAVLLVGVIGGSLAYLITDTDPVTNTFTPGKVDITVSEEFIGNIKNNVKITLSEDSVKAKIRAMVVVTWQDEDGNVYPKAPVEETDYTISWTKSGWTGPDANGWYNHAAIEPGTSTGILFTNCKPVDSNTPKGYHLVVDVIAEAIQDDGGAQW